MKMKFRKNILRTGISLLALAVLSSSYLFGKENIGQKRSSNKGLRTAASCAPASSSTELDVNNVRALIHNGGDFWWDLVGQPRYEVPKLPASEAASAKHSSFAGSLWIGGVDESGQLRIAAQTYRQSGNDFWPGPLTDGGAAIDDVTCEQWDDHYKITKAEIDAFRAAYAAFESGGAAVNLDDYPAVKNWPAYGEDADGNRLALAPFVDYDGDNLTYTPEAGDYPDIQPVDGGGEPDMAIWWIINDKGDVHTETGGEAIGLEISMLAFAFSTANAINDMTFYKYNVINKSNITLNETFMGQWVDADIGNFADDYVGCDTVRGLGFAYNGNSVDGTAAGYGANPPALGMDFFQGPFGDNGTRLPMQRFVYYENDFSLRGNPEVATHFYGYLRGFWKDGSRMVDNGQNGYAPTAPGPETDYMFPGDAGFCGGVQVGWSEASAGNQPFDRRFLQSAGPFTLQPGAVNDIITGAVWARGFYNDNLGSVCELLSADDVAQALFDNDFQLLDGPDAPELTIAEYDSELMLSWTYPDQKADLYNNYNESYLQVDPVLATSNSPDSLFRFQGYILYQLRDASVSASDLFNTDLARIVAQCDIEDDVTAIVNRTEQTVGGLAQPVIVDEVMVQGANEGIFNSISVTDDQFASGDDRRLKNYTTYYYGILAYAYNDTSSDGRQFVQGNRFFVNTSAMPHPIDFENFGTTVGADYGDGLQITQISGVGNGGNDVELTSATINNILNNDSVGTLVYEAGRAPVQVKVIDPKGVTGGDYRLEVVEDQFEGTVDTIVFRDASNYIIDSTFIEWFLTESSQQVARSTYVKRVIRGSFGNREEFRPIPLSGIERPVEGHGISISVRNPRTSGDTAINGVINAEIVYDDPLNAWLAGNPDNDGLGIWNWLLAGSEETDRGVGNTSNPLKADRIYDPEENFESILGGVWAPFCMARSFQNGDQSGNISPGVEIAQANNARTLNSDSAINLDDLPDIDIIFTSNPDDWSRCVVVETASDRQLSSGAFPMSARWSLSIDSRGANGPDNPNDTISIANQGFSYFPGYAIDVNTGRRLNIFFGENSWDKVNNGDDMLWNPTSSFGPNGQSAGGRHFVYVTDLTYDGCESLRDNLTNGEAANYYNQFGQGPSGSQLWMDPNNNFAGDTTTDMRQIYKHVAWVGTPMLNPNFSFDDPNNIPTTARVRLRVNQPFTSRGGTMDYPIFTFSTSDISAQTGAREVAEASLMDDVRIVPNPYYAYSTYEASQLQTVVKLINLPQRCDIKIFTLNGTLIRTFIKDSDSPEQRWDLRNADGVPVASGVYIIHVNGFELGEKIVKFFATMPQLDLNAF